MTKHSPLNKYLVSIIGILLTFGFVMIYNATVVFAQGEFGKAYHFVLLHLGWVSLGLIGAYFLSKYDYHKFNQIAYIVLGLTLLPLGLLALVGLIRQTNIVECNPSSFLVPCINGASRWVTLNLPALEGIPLVGNLGFQPGELAKLALIIYLAVVISKLKGGTPKTLKVSSRDTRNSGEIDIFKTTIIATGIVAFLVFMQPNLSTASIIFMIGICIYFASGEPIKPLLYFLPALASVGLMFIFTSSYRRARILTLLNGSSGGVEDLQAGYHIKQILIALGSGGFWGLGIGQSRQKFQYLPEVAADSIFAIVGEELGFVGTTLLIVLFLFFIFTGFKIAQEAPDMLGKLLAVGITSWIGLQFFINVAAMTRIIPLTGVPLPLISYGGSSTIFVLLGIGILANVSRQNKC